MDWKRLVDAYIQHLRAQHVDIPVPLPGREEFARLMELQRKLADANPYVDAWEELDELIRTDPKAALDVLAQVLEKVPVSYLGTIGCGPLEYLLVEEGAEVSDEILKLLEKSQPFRFAFAFARYEDDASPDLVEAVGQLLDRLGTSKEALMDEYQRELSSQRPPR